MMNRQFAHWIQGLSLTCLPLVACAAGPDGVRGFVEDSTWNLLNRSVYDRRDYRHGGLNGAARNAFKPRSEHRDQAEEWGYGLMASFSSGFTQGTVGLGLDAHAYLGVKLDSGGGRAGKARLLSVDNEGHPEDNYGRAGAAVKLRLSSTVLKYGEQRVKTPVFGSSDSRLLPETATGWLVTSHERDDLTLDGGHSVRRTFVAAASTVARWTPTAAMPIWAMDVTENTGNATWKPATKYRTESQRECPSARYAMHRGNTDQAELDADQIRFAVEYPI